MFHIRGRINRTTYLLGSLYAAALILPFYVQDQAALAKKLEANAMLSLALTVFLTGVIYLLACLAARRLHDMGLSAWWTLLVLIPGAQVVLLLYPGHKGKNKYGSEPAKQFDNSALFS